MAEVRAAILTHIMPISEEKYQGDVANYEGAHNYKPLFLTSQLYEVYHNTTSKTKWKQYNMLLPDFMENVKTYAKSMFYYTLWNNIIYSGENLKYENVKVFKTEEDVKNFIQARYAECEIRENAGAAGFNNIQKAFK